MAYFWRRRRQIGPARLALGPQPNKLGVKLYLRQISTQRLLAENMDTLFNRRQRLARVDISAG